MRSEILCQANPAAVATDLTPHPKRVPYQLLIAVTLLFVTACVLRRHGSLVSIKDLLT